MKAPLVRALSKLNLASRTEAALLIRQGRVRVDGRVVTDGRVLVVPESAAITIDGQPAPRGRQPRRVLAFHKPRGVVTTRRDPEGRPTTFDALGDAGRGLVAVGRLDLASSGLLIFTNDTQLAHRLTNPEEGIPRRYAVTVRGLVDAATAARLESGLQVDAPGGGRERLRAASATIRKASRRETHLVITLTEGRNREIRRLLAAAGHRVTRIHRFAFGPVELGALPPGAWRLLDPAIFD